MISAKKLGKMAKKWQRLAASNRKSITFPGRNRDAYTSSKNVSPLAEKGHFVVYIADQCRFMLPMSYLDNEIIRQLLDMSEEEYGPPGNGPITLPCDAAFLEYLVSLIERRVDREMGKTLLLSIASSRCSLPYCSSQEQNSQILITCSC